MKKQNFTAAQVAVPEMLYTRFREPVNVFASKTGEVLCRDILSREVSPATVARAVSMLPTPFDIHAGTKNHPIEAIRDGFIQAPLLVLDSETIFTRNSREALPIRTRGDEPTETPHSHLGCYIPPWLMLEKFDITVGACGITGQLLPDSKAIEGSMFDECVDSQIGPDAIRDHGEALNLLPHILEIEEMLNNPTMLDRPLEAVRLDSPEGYDTDAPVSEGQKEKGIRAWRRLENPANADQSIMLPIYDTDLIPYDLESTRAAEAAKVPRAGDDGSPENFIDYDGILYPLAVSMVALRDSPALWGGAGLGKSAAYRHLSYLMGLPFERISITMSTEVDELAGKMEYHPDEGTVFRYGRLANAWTKPSVICLDEPNSARPDVWFMLRPLLDSEKQLAIDASHGEILPRHESSYLGLAMNPSWDYRNSGTNPLADADVSRLTHVQVGLPPENVEADIVRMHSQTLGFNISDSQLRQMRKIANDLRDTAAAGSLMFSWGTRSQLKVAKLLPYMTMEQAYQAALGASLEPEQEDLFLSTVRGHL